MKQCFTIILGLLISNAYAQQITLTLQPNALQGKDAELWNLNPNTNYGSWPELKQNAWTWQGAPGLQRSVIDFTDLAQIPDSAEIISATLSLYGNPDGSAEYDYYDAGKNNTCLIKRIVKPWDESTVTWNNQPKAVSQNKVKISRTETPYKDYTGIDVTALVQDYINDKANSFGFLLKLKKENYYSRMVFKSSDEGDLSEAPKLVVVYQSQGGKSAAQANNNLSDASAQLMVYPNPGNGEFELSIPTGEVLLNSFVSVTDLQGRILKHFFYPTLSSNAFNLNLRELPSGEYLIKVTSSGESFVGKIIKE